MNVGKNMRGKLKRYATIYLVYSGVVFLIVYLRRILSHKLDFEYGDISPWFE